MRVFFSSLFLIILSVTTFSQNALTLDEAIKIALQRNTDLKRSVNNIKSFESNVKTAYGNLLPSIGASGSWRWNKDQHDVGSTTLSSEGRDYSVGVGTDWTLFDGLSNYSSVSENKANLESARFSLERAKQNIVFQTISFYYDVVNNTKLLQVQEENVKWNQKNLETITERNKLGAVTLADVYAQQVRAGNAELELIRAKNNLETSKSNILYFLGIDVLTDFAFVDSLTESQRSVIEGHSITNMDTINVLIDQAFTNRPDYQGAKLNLESSMYSVNVARGGHFPRLTNNNNFSAFAPSLSDVFKNRSYSVGLTLSIPIFSGFAVENRVQLAEVGVLNSQLDLNNIERDIKRGLQKTLLDLQTSEVALDVSRSNVRAAEENRRIEQEKYNLGSGTLLNVLIASSEFTTAQTNYINAQFAYITLSEQLRYQIGLLNYKKYE